MTERPGDPACVEMLNDLVNYHVHRTFWNASGRAASREVIVQTAERIRQLVPNSELAVRATLHIPEATHDQDPDGAMALAEQVIQQADELGYGILQLDGRLVRAKFLEASNKRAAARAIWVGVLEHEVPRIDWSPLRLAVEGEVKTFIGLSYAADGDAVAALPWFESVTDPRFEVGQQAVGYSSAAWAYEALGRYDDALAALDRVLSDYSDTLTATVASVDRARLAQRLAEQRASSSADGD